MASKSIRYAESFLVLIHRTLTKSSGSSSTRDAIPVSIVAMWMRTRPSLGMCCIRNGQSGSRENAGRLMGAAWQAFFCKASSAPIFPTSLAWMNNPLLWTKFARSSSEGSREPDKIRVRSILFGSVVSMISTSDSLSYPSRGAGMCNAGITAAAGLYFLPTGLQRYGLAIRPEMLGDPKICSLIAAIRSPEYHRLLSEYSGYDLSQTGAAHQYYEDHTIREITKDTLQAFSE